MVLLAIFPPLPKYPTMEHFRGFWPRGSFHAGNHMGSRLLDRFILLAAPCLLVAAPASAHHAMGGPPSTAIEGFLSGLGHPVIGADHLALLLAVGVIVGVARLSVLLPAFFFVVMASA